MRGTVGTVLQLAHTHLLGEHLGMDKTWEWITARFQFHWPRMKKAVEAARSVKSLPQKHTSETRWSP